MSIANTKDLLEEAYERYARPEFIENDPIQVPRTFSDRKNAEVIGFLTATIAWGQRKTIINNAWKLVELMDRTPHAFVMNATEQDLSTLDRFVHRTFNGVDLRHFILGLRHVYTRYGGLEDAFFPTPTKEKPMPWSAPEGIALFKQRFFEPAHERRTQKHVADPAKGSNAKRINMYLRWMVRPNDRGIDMGHWKRIPTSALLVPLDVHTGRVGRDLGLLHRKQDDLKAVLELTERLREFDPVDPVRYDIALFGMGVDKGS
ncbi:MAG: TIGR02757 family protein [Flavobacteriales bacterium]|nr:TIGR02757 family protein [Flavobacteriales bacterium]